MILGLGNTIPINSVRQGLGGGGGGSGFDNTYSLAFDGVDDFLDITPSHNLSGEFGISVWFKNNALGNDGMLLGKGASGTNSLVWLYNTTKIYVNVGGSTATFNNDGTNPIPTSGSSWANLLIWRDNTDTVHCYLNNQNFGTLSIFNPTQTNDFTFDRIGGAAATYFWNGNIDEVSIYNTALSLTDRNTIYGTGTPSDISSISGLIAWYRNGDNGSYKSPQWLIPENSNKDKVSNYSFNFDGVDDRIDVGAVSFLPSATNLTVSTWLKTSDVTDNQVVFGDNSATPIFSFEYWGSANRMYFEYGSGLYCYLTLNLVVSNDVWHNLALVYDGSGATNTDKIKIYINGVDKSSSLTFVGTVPTALNASIGNLWLGNGQNYNSPFLGNIDEFAIWNSSLTQENITTIYNSGIPTTLPVTPVAHWKMGEEANFTILME